MSRLPKVLLVGGPDVDARLELMQRLKNSFDIGAVGSHPALRAKFLSEGFEYSNYHLNRKVNPLSDLLTLGQLISLFRKQRPMIVHTFDTKPDIWGCLAARLARVSVIVGTLTGLGPDSDEGNLKSRSVGRIYQQLQKSVSNFSDMTIFQNHDDAHQYLSKGIVPEQKSTVILGSGVPTELFSRQKVSTKELEQLRQDLKIQPNEIVVTMISRVIRSKGVFEYLESAKQINVEHPNVRFLLIGAEDKASLDALNDDEIKELKQGLLWPGFKKNIPAVLAASDIFVLPSAYREGIPRVLLEAASMGLPIVTTNSAGCNEVVKEAENGFLVEVGNSVALNRAILLLIEQPQLRQQFGNASRQRVVKYFDISVIAQQTESLYQQLLENKNK